MKRTIAIILSICLLLSVMAGCSPQTDADGKIKIVTTLFPAYDFAKNIAGDNVEVSLLLPPGTESHSYEPTPKDMVEIQNCDLFIYNGGESESWVEGIIDSLNEGEFDTLKMIDSAEHLLTEDADEHEHDHEHEHEHEDEDEHEHEGDEVGYDEHIWTSPVVCIDICEDIKDKLCEIDGENKAVYEKNCQEYIGELEELDGDIREITESAKRCEIIFGDRFPFKYFAEEYSLTYHAAFPGCSTQTEPSAAKMAELINKTNEDNIPVVFYIEMSNRSVANTLSEATGTETLLFHSCHNLTKDEFESGESYISLMEKNAANLKIALN